MATKNLFQFLADRMKRAAREPAVYLPALPGKRTSGLNDGLTGLDTASEQIDETVTADTWSGKVSAWRQHLGNLATVAFARSQEDVSAAKNELAVRYLQVNHPRLAALFNATGIIQWAPDANLGRSRSNMDWQRLHQLITDPEAVMTAEMWDNMSANGTNANADGMAGIVAALMVMAPQTLRALHSDQLLVDGPPLPPVRNAANAAWAQFRQDTKGWFSVTLPFGDPSLPKDDQMPRGFPFGAEEGLMDWIPDLVPDLSATLAIRSERRTVTSSNEKVLDFEAWLALTADQDRWEYNLGHLGAEAGNWMVSIDPGITAGVGYNGETKEWKADFKPVYNQSLPTLPDDPLTVSFYGENLHDRTLLGSDMLRVVFEPPQFWLKLRRVAPWYEVGFTFAAFDCVLAPPDTFQSLMGLMPAFLEVGMRLRLGLDLSYAQGIGPRLNRSNGLVIHTPFGTAPSDPGLTDLTDGIEPPSTTVTPDGLGVIWHINKEFEDEDKGATLKLHSIRFVAEFEPFEDHLNWRIKIQFHLSGKLGPLEWVADGAGVGLGFWDPGFEKLLPTGIGLALEVGPVKGGGYLDFTGGPTQRYAGLLNLRIYEFEVIAFGIHELIEVKAPDGEVIDTKTSFIAVIGVLFDPGIPLGWGFSLTGLGGIVGLNRRLDVDALQHRLVSGAVSNVLFPTDPVRNAPTILGDLDALFPRTNNVHVVGPTGRLTWADQVDLDVAFLIEIAVGNNRYGTSGLTKVVILGTGRSVVEVDGKKLVKLHFELAGVLDLVRDAVEFDAVLVRSHIMDLFHLSGSVAFRSSWSDRPYMLLSVGGFHPDFSPEPVRFPKLYRMLAAYQKKTDDYELQLSIKSYQAYTTNTIQMGMRIEAKAKWDAVRIHGWLGYDALIQFRPFFFSVGFAAGFEVRYGGATLAGVRVSGLISGPGPLTITAELCIELLFIDICTSDTWIIGEPVNQPLPIVDSLLAELTPELANPNNLSVLGGEDRQVAVSAALTDQGETVVSPIGGLTWSQKRAPLDTLIERFEGSPLSRPQAVEVQSPQANGGQVREYFSPGSFAELDDSEALNRASFERLPAGLALGFDAEHAKPVGRDITVQQYVLPRLKSQGQAAIVLPALVLDGINGRVAAANDFKRSAAAIRVKDEGWVVRAGDGGELSTDLSQTEAHQRARWQDAMALPVNDMISWEVA